MKFWKFNCFSHCKVFVLATFWSSSGSHHPISSVDLIRSVLLSPSWANIRERAFERATKPNSFRCCMLLIMTSTSFSSTYTKSITKESWSVFSSVLLDIYYFIKLSSLFIWPPKMLALRIYSVKIDNLPLKSSSKSPKCAPDSVLLH